MFQARSPTSPPNLQLSPVTPRPLQQSTSGGTKFRFPDSAMLRMPAPRFQLGGRPSLGSRQISPSLSQTSSPSTHIPGGREQVIIVSGDGSQTVEEVLVEDNNNNNKSKSQKVNNVFVILPRSFIK